MKYKMNHKYRIMFSKENYIKILIYDYLKEEYHIESLYDGSLKKSIVDNFFIESMNLKDDYSDVKSVDWSGKISNEDIECIQQFFEEKIDEKTIRESINSRNWNGDWNKVLDDFGIKGDTCNREFVCECIEGFKGFSLE